MENVKQNTLTRATQALLERASQLEKLVYSRHIATIQARCIKAYRLF